MSVIGTRTSPTAISIEYLDEHGRRRVIEFPTDRWRSANRLIRRVVRREATA